MPINSMKKEIPRTPEGYQEIVCKDLPYYEPRTEDEARLFKSKIKSINMKVIIMIIVAIVFAGIVIFSPAEYYTDPVWRSKLIAIFIAGLTIYLIFRSVINGFVFPGHKIHGKIGKIESVHWHMSNGKSKSKTGYAVVIFPDNNQAIKQVMIDTEVAKATNKGDEILVVSFNGKVAYGFIKDKYSIDISKKKSSIMDVIGSMVFVAIFTFIIFGIVKTDMNTGEYEAKIMETRYIGTEIRHHKRNRTSTVHIEEAEVYIEELDKTVTMELSGNNKTHLPEKGRVIKIVKSNGEWIRNDGMIVFYIGFGVGLLVSLVSLIRSIVGLRR